MSKNLSKNSLGLSGISERVMMLGGKMRIESGEGGGTSIEIELHPPRPSLKKKGEGASFADKKK